MHVSGGSICGHKKQGAFVSTGDHKGNYTLYVCDKKPHDARQQHHDSHANKHWR